MIMMTTSMKNDDDYGGDNDGNHESHSNYADDYSSLLISAHHITPWCYRYK